MIKKGRVTVIVESLNHGRLLNELSRNGIAFLDCKRQYKRLTLSVDAKDFKKTKELIDDFGAKYIYSKNYGVLPFFRSLASRVGLWAGLIATISFVLLYSLCYFDYEISGLDSDKTSKVEELLEVEAGDYGLKSKISTDDLRMKINALEGVAISSVYFRGARLIIDCLSALPTPDVEDKKYQPVIAARDGIITKIIVTGGRTTLKVGDSVKKGDVLIYPEYLVSETETVPAPASGEVYGRSWISEKKF